MHVAIITTSYPDDVPGSEAAGSFVADFARQLAEHGRVSVIAAASRSSRVKEGDVEVIRFRVPRTPLSLLRPHRPGDWLAIAKTLQNGKRAVQQAVRDTAPDLLFALWALPSGLWAQQAARRFGMPFAVWALGSDIWSLGRIPLVRRKLAQVLRSAGLCYADGLELAADVERLAGRHCEFLASTRLLPRPAAAGGSASAPYNLAFLGRWHRNKGVDLLLDALQQLSAADWARITAVRLHGGGPLADDVRRLAARLEEQGRPVSVGGYLDKQGAADLIGWADYLMLPSRVESIPVVFSDAVQLRTPVVATPVGDLPALFGKYSVGLVAADASTAGFAAALREALGDDANRYRPGLDAAAAAFDLEKIVARFAADVEPLCHD